ncbi:MAG: LLM class flavin-dependent oxidoreductase [Actinobacteria bacterium]|nr:LLM class flavin-dependent oxidoreductase [Actinomycetota bacterium]
MRFCIDVPNFGRWADPRTFAEFAAEVEAAGWDGLSVWDHILPDDGVPTADPWVLLAAAAAATDRIVLMSMVTPLPRRHPWKVARESVSIDLLSGGRFVLGVGSGALGPELGRFHVTGDLRVRADMLDEGLEVLTGLWTGEPYEFHGDHYDLEQVTFTPAPLQQPRIPVWVAAMWPSRRPVRRAARWDGVVPIFYSVEDDVWSEPTPGLVREITEYAALHRRSEGPFDLAVYGDLAEADEYAAAGATWMRHGWFPEIGFGFDEWKAAMLDGPPR